MSRGTPRQSGQALTDRSFLAKSKIATGASEHVLNAKKPPRQWGGIKKGAIIPAHAAQSVHRPREAHSIQSEKSLAQ